MSTEIHITVVNPMCYAVYMFGTYFQYILCSVLFWMSSYCPFCLLTSNVISYIYTCIARTSQYLKAPQCCAWIGPHPPTPSVADAVPYGGKPKFCAVLINKWYICGKDSLFALHSVPVKLLITFMLFVHLAISSRMCIVKVNLVSILTPRHQLILIQPQLNFSNFLCSVLFFVKKN